jgi:flagella basal body P-ring formation protein FlgA
VRFFLILIVVLVRALAAPRAFACHLLEGDHILASDLMAANPDFDALDPKIAIAPAPAPGVSRVLRPEEIARLARINNVTLSFPVTDLCFERVAEQLTPESLMPALRAALAIEDARIEILDFSRFGIPHGALSFSRSGLSSAGLSSTSLWRGHVTYDQSRTIPVWVRVRITADRSWVEATELIPSGKRIEAPQLVLKKGPRFPFGPGPLDTIDLAATHKSLRTIRSGEPIFASMLTTLCEVERGDTVRVEVSSGRARLEFDAVAQSAGRAGESVMVKNTESSRYFRARVEAKGKVSVTR